MKIYGWFLIALFCLIGIASYLIFRRIWKRNSRIRSWAMNITLVTGTLVAILIFLELSFCYAIDQSDGFAITLRFQKWLSQHWHPINSWGYRDIEHVDIKDKRVVFVVGDSFVAGHGIKNYRDRFANQLAMLLGKDVEVIIVAQNGWDTQQEFNHMKKIPVQPDIIILSHFINDIERSIHDQGIPTPRLNFTPKGIWGKIVSQSYFFNFLFWHYLSGGFKAGIEKYSNFFYDAYQSEEIVRMHEKKLNQFIIYTRRKDISLLVLVWPQLDDLAHSYPMTEKIVTYFQNNGIETIDLLDYIKGRPKEDLVVGSLDGHPSVKISREVAAILFQRIQPYLGKMSPPQTF